MGVRTDKQRTLDMLDAHMNVRCDGDCGNCSLSRMYVNEKEEITYCDALSMFAEKFFMEKGILDGSNYHSYYIKEVRDNFDSIFEKGVE